MAADNPLKVCTKCKESKPLSEFSPRWKKKAPGKLRPICKACNNVVSLAWAAAHRDGNADRMRKKRKRLKDACFGAYGGYRCSCCGEIEPKFLQLDHIDNDGGHWRKQMFGGQFQGRRDASMKTYQWLWNHGFPEGFQVLCANCNFGKRMNHGVCPHKEQQTDRAVVAAARERA